MRNIKNCLKLKVKYEKLVVNSVKTIRKKPKLDINELFKEKYKGNKELNWGKVSKEEW